MTADAGETPPGGARALGAVPLRDYAMQEAQFAIPAAWQDQTVHILAAVGSAGGPPECSLVVHRDALQAGESLDAYVARQRANLQATLPEFRLVREGARTLGGVQARDAEYRFAAEAGLLRQRQVYVLRLGRALTLTATAPERLWAKHAPSFDAVLATWKFAAAIVDPRRDRLSAPPPEGYAGGAP